MTSKDSNVSSIPELTDFEVSYSLLTNEVYLHFHLTHRSSITAIAGSSSARHSIIAG
ncbi:hypothetical protein AC338_000403 [Salmonella enterica subsp. enterica]|nr:hypothetical protein [Salmonella enterica subsp. enterica]EDR6901984.1 hypothetical protein [Salmonella enterica subsp. enterica serovar Havana]EDS3107041.1 hypothetical protein [Salmonella enterica subsp. enterica serovar Cullingworth]EDT9665032.1 hypothetical protein [Salmonella enterica subsp. enterica serovar Louisiana]EDW9279237.1 hypothetical protein [Salmonella enterica subsp. enterica serovar Stockholm]EDX8419297.1 hypothetical protein [Salmonella enterica subsp. enterica serovar Ri